MMQRSNHKSQHNPDQSRDNETQNATEHGEIQLQSATINNSGKIHIYYFVISDPIF